jgi:hypothetical protein
MPKGDAESRGADEARATIRAQIADVWRSHARIGGRIGASTVAMTPQSGETSIAFVPEVPRSIARTFIVRVRSSSLSAMSGEKSRSGDIFFASARLT